MRRKGYGSLSTSTQKAVIRGHVSMICSLERALHVLSTIGSTDLVRTEIAQQLLDGHIVIVTLFWVFLGFFFRFSWSPEDESC